MAETVDNGDNPQAPGYLKKELDSGRGIHEIIQGLITEDGKVLSKHATQYWMAKSDGKAVEPLDADIVDRYEIRPEKNPDYFWGNEMTFAGGFNYLATKIYPALVKVTLLEPEQKSDPLSEREMKLLSVLSSHLNSPDKGKERDLNGMQNPNGKEIVLMEEIRRSLEDDPSGVSWLQEQARQRLKTNVMGLAGANKAILGIERLYKQLNGLKLEYH